ncbi:MAG: hypothetical protein WD069_21955 [Planctomycetales bacterium]
MSARFRILDAIRRLDPERECQRIVFLSSCFDFSFDTTRSLEFALFRTYCVPSISGLLDRTGEFRARPQKRYDDTDLIVSELMEWDCGCGHSRRGGCRPGSGHVCEPNRRTAPTRRATRSSGSGRPSGPCGIDPPAGSPSR